MADLGNLSVIFQNFGRQDGKQDGEQVAAQDITRPRVFVLFSVLSSKIMRRRVFFLICYFAKNFVGYFATPNIRINM